MTMFKLSIARAKVSKVLRAGLIRDDSHFAYDAGLDDPCLDDHGDCAAPALDQSKIHQDENDDTQSQQAHAEDQAPCEPRQLIATLTLSQIKRRNQAAALPLEAPPPTPSSPGTPTCRSLRRSLSSAASLAAASMNLDHDSSSSFDLL